MKTKDYVTLDFWVWCLFLFLGLGLCVSYCGKKSCDCGCRQGDTCRCADVESHNKSK